MSLRLTEKELFDLTQYEQPRRQLDALHADGFWRATLDRKGRVKLERAHYEAVCAGAVKDSVEKPRPTLRPIKREDSARTH